MTGSVVALQTALSNHLKANSGVQSVFGVQPRIQLDSGEERPLFPYISFAAHRVTENGGLDIEIDDHTIDLNVFTRWGGRQAGREAVKVIRDALENKDFPIEGHALAWSFIPFSDTLMLRDMATMKGVIRLRIRTTPSA